MIRSFACAHTKALFEGRASRRHPPDIWARSRIKLALLDAATTLADLRVPPGNQLEALVGSRQGQWSIRVNGQWRLCFAWSNGSASDVEIVDYH